MTLENLKNKPLVEAIFEIRWYVDQQNPLSINSNTQFIPLFMRKLRHNFIGLWLFRAIVVIIMHNKNSV